ncbi:peptide-methionine (S)-S-oxide reductase MsrA [Rubrobacter aplysinae]|uniref:peptide-methionine (S)-S-oxide reductase MsrA n=1 Tax=Rubrobacter aplysinae TaxID=909625 RepID=UPI00064B88F0|nr:peptide-methionine (S)-S-oxide reductase MsrA [Rubrobacter aplysinae]
MSENGSAGANSTRSAIFGAGCFWGVESAFRKVPGVIDAPVGYSGGSVADPSYEQVCSGRTGHAEVVEVEYDPEKVSYDELLDVFWSLHDPTQKNRQGPDVGTQYRSAIFYQDEDQLRSAEASKERAQSALRKSIATEITAAGPFYRAEEYHQRYFEKKGIASCPV